MPTITLTDHEAGLLRWVMRQANFGGVDWKKAAQELGYSSTKTVRDEWYPVRDKVMGKAKASECKNTAKPSDGIKRKDSATSTPAPTTKKTKTTKGEKAKTPSATDNADDEEEGTKVKAQPDAVLDEDIFADGDFFT